MIMLVAGQYHTLTVLRIVPIGAYLDDGAQGILLPNRFLPRDAKEGDQLRVFVYHDGEDRLIATTQIPKAVAGEIAYLRVVGANNQGAFADLGLMKDLFIPKSQQRQPMHANGDYFIRVQVDAQTGRMIGTEKITPYLQNETLTVAERDTVRLLVYRETQIGFVCIINHVHTGVLHYSDIFQPIREGMILDGHIRKIRQPDPLHAERGFRLDLAVGKYGGKARATDAASIILDALADEGGFLPFHDKSDADAIYARFAMSKKTFKMTIGNLYRQQRILLEDQGIRLVK